MLPAIEITRRALLGGTAATALLALAGREDEAEAWFFGRRPEGGTTINAGGTITTVQVTNPSTTLSYAAGTLRVTYAQPFAPETGANVPAGSHVVPYSNTGTPTTPIWAALSVGTYQQDQESYWGGGSQTVPGAPGSTGATKVAALSFLAPEAYPAAALIQAAVNNAGADEATVGSGAGTENGGIGDAIVGASAPPSLRGTPFAFIGTTAATQTITGITASQNDIVIIVMTINSSSVSSISLANVASPSPTGGGTMQRRASGGAAPYPQEYWWGYATGAVSSESATVTLASSNTYFGAHVFIVQGAQTPSSPFDPNSALPATSITGDVSIPTNDSFTFCYASYRFTNASPTVGSGWTLITTSFNQISEYQQRTTSVGSGGPSVTLTLKQAGSSPPSWAVAGQEMFVCRVNGSSNQYASDGIWPVTAAGTTVVGGTTYPTVTFAPAGNPGTLSLATDLSGTINATCGPVYTYQLRQQSGGVNRTGLALSTLTANTDIRLVLQNAVVGGISTGDFNPGDVWEVSVNDIVTNGQPWPWTSAPVTATAQRDGNGNLYLTGIAGGTVQVGQYVSAVASGVPAGYTVLTVTPNFPSAGDTGITIGYGGGNQWFNGFTAATWSFTNGPTRGWELIRSGPLCTEWALWGLLRCTTSGGTTAVGTVHPWIRAKFYVRVWTPGGTFNPATSPIEIGGYWAQPNIFGPNPGTTYSGAEPAHVFQAQLVNANTVLMQYGGANDGNPNYQGSVTGFNPSGLNSNRTIPGISAPSAVGLNIPITVGASPFTYTNNTNFQQTVTVSGGTVSSIVVNTPSGPITEPTTSGSFVVGGFYYITVTYSAAPTMNYSNGFITVTEAQVNSMLGAASSYLVTAGAFGNGAVPVVVSTTGSLPTNSGGPNDGFGLVAAPGSGGLVSNPYWAGNYNIGYLNGTSGPVLLFGGSKWGSSSDGTFTPNPVGGPGFRNVGTGWRADGSNAGIIHAYTSGGSGTLTITTLAESFPGMATAFYDWDAQRVLMVNGTNVGVAKQQYTVAHNFMYLTTQSRCLPPYLPPQHVNAASSVFCSTYFQPAEPIPYSCCSAYYGLDLNETGDNYGDDRIGWLSFSQSTLLYRPFDWAMVTRAVNVALYWLHVNIWSTDESHGTPPVVNVTQYANYGAPIGPYVARGNAGFLLSFNNGYPAWTDSWSYWWAGYDRGAGNAMNGSHMPAPNILPYLLTGDFIHYENMAMMTTTRWFGSTYDGGPITCGVVGGTTKSGQALGQITVYKQWSFISTNGYPDDSFQLRGYGWMMRHVGTSVHFMPSFLGDGATPRPEYQYIRDQFHDLMRCPAALSEAPGGITTFATPAWNLGTINSEPNYSDNEVVPWMSSFAHDYGFIGWAMEAWRGEYWETIDFLWYWSQFAIGRFDEHGTGPLGPGFLWWSNLYTSVALTDVNGNALTTLEQMIENSGSIPNAPGVGSSSFDAIANTTSGSNAITLVTQSPNPWWNSGFFIGIYGFGDFPPFTFTNSNGTGAGTVINALTSEVIEGGAGTAVNSAGPTRTALTTTAAAAATGSQTQGSGATSIQVNSIGSGATAVQVGYAVFDETNGSAISVGQYVPTLVTSISGSGPYTLGLSQQVGLDFGGSVASGDTILIGPLLRASLVPVNWPGIATVLSDSAATTVGNHINAAPGGDDPNYNLSYTAASAMAMALADCVYRTTGNAAFAHAAAVYAEFRRRQYHMPVATYDQGTGPLNFVNSPVFAVGTIGSTS